MLKQVIYAPHLEKPLRKGHRKFVFDTDTFFTLSSEAPAQVDDRLLNQLKGDPVWERLVECHAVTVVDAPQPEIAPDAKAAKAPK